MKNLALKRLSLLSVPNGTGLDAKKKIVFLSVLAKMGYRITNPELLDRVSNTFWLDYNQIIAQLKSLRDDVKYVPLFKGFPENTPDDDIYFEKRLLGYWGNIFGFIKESAHTVKLDNGMIIPNWLFNAYNFGANPITQFQTKELFERGVDDQNNRAQDDHTEWFDLELVFDTEIEAHLEKFMLNLLYAKSSIKESLQEDLMTLLNHFGTSSIDSTKLVRKETSAFISSYFWKQKDYESVEMIVKNATDLLRMFAALTNSDVSLGTVIRFPKLKRAERKIALGILNKCNALAEDMNRYKSLWLEIGRYLHPAEYTSRFPETAKAFDLLRNGKVITFNGQTERYLADGSLKELLNHLSQRPGIFLRKLHEILRKFPSQTNSVIYAFKSHLPKVPLKNLLTLQAYFTNINDLKKRTVVNKKGKIKVLDNNSFGKMNYQVIGQLSDILMQGILDQLEQKDSWFGKKVYIDPNISHYTVPLQQRKASDGILTVGRGSQIDVDLGKVLRLFVYWKQKVNTTDLDLSVMEFDEKFKFIGHVSYTNLKSDGIAHSGDIQSAPYGAAEFIDISLKKVKSKVKYLGIQVRYTGDAFTDMDCHAGWMIRDKVDSNVKSFDIKTVQNKFDLNGTGAYCVPLIINLKERKAIITDLYVSGKALHNNVEGSNDNVSVIGKELSTFVQNRPNMYTLSMMNLEARYGEMVQEKEEADVSIGLKNCDINVTDVEKILTELI